MSSEENLRGEIDKIAKFLNKPLNKEQLDALTEHLKFDNFQKNESVNFEAAKKTGFLNEELNFIRKGKTGDWVNHFSPELNSEIDEWIERNLKGTDLKFISELKDQD